MTAAHTPGPLTVFPTGAPRQFRIDRGEGGCPPDMEWEAYYVEFSGYFGAYGPHTFAAAPDMLEALKAVVVACTSAPPIEIVKRIDAALWLCAAAISKAEGK